MCGVAGILKLGDRPLDPFAIKPMCDAIAHRGPDDAGYAFFTHGDPARGGEYWVGFVDDEFHGRSDHLPSLGGEYARRELPRFSFDLALGHRRLSVLDLSQYGHQPMSSPDRRIWVAYNGEIYNFRELRSELEAKGHVFRTECDTEVLIHLWHEYGADCLEKIDGMFAFALVDRADRSLFLARDRFGVKPMYTAEQDGFLLFGSEPKAILASGMVERGLDPGALVEYLTFQNLYSDRAVLKGVRSLPAGHVMRIPLGREGVIETRAYHAGYTGEEADWSFDESVERVADAFTQAVERQLVSDVPVGAYLSGGMDSGSIVAVAGRSLPRLATFTGGFDLTNVSGIEQGFDERPQAERLSHLLQTEHYAVVLHAGDMPAAMEQIAYHVDDPRLGMCHQNWYVAKLASRFVKVCLAGAGGDELFGGYPWRYRQAAGATSAQSFDDAYFAYWHRLLPPGGLEKMLHGDLRPYVAETRGVFDQVLHGGPRWDEGADDSNNLLRRALHFEFKTFMHGFLAIEDRMSMAHSMESRVPFLDNRLTELAFQIPGRHKVRTAALESKDEHLETAEGKWVLRSAMESLLPRDFTQMKKQGFSPPDENWYRGPSMNYVKEILFDPRTEQRPWFDAPTVRLMLGEHFKGERNHRLLIWSLLSLEWLQRHFVDADGMGAPRGS